jgi:hypothetical protein
MLFKIQILRKIKLAAFPSVFLAAGISLCGCDHFFHDSSPKKNVIELKSAQDAAACLSETFSVVGGYFNRTVSLDKTDQIFNCAQSTIDLFTRKAHGEQADGYSKAELQVFVEDLLNNTTFDSRWIDSALQIKQAWFGGSTDVLSRSEVAQIKIFLSTLKDIFHQSDAYADVIGQRANLNPNHPEDRERLLATRLNLLNSAQLLSMHLTKGNQPPYSLESLKPLLNASERGASAAEYLPLIEAAKSVFLKPPAQIIEAKDWSLIFQTAAQAYGLYLSYHYGFNNGQVGEEPRLTLLSADVDLAFSILDQSLQRHEKNQISAEELTTLISQLGHQGFLPKKITADSLKSSLGPVLNKILNSKPEYRDLSVPPSFGGDEFLALKDFFADWVSGQRLILKLTTDQKQTQSKEDLVKKIKALQAPNAIATAVQNEMAALLDQGRALSWTPQESLKIDSANEPMNRHDLTVFNTIRTIAHHFLRAYSHDLDRRTGLTGLTSAEAQEVYVDFRSLGIDLHFMDPRIYTAGTRSFTEASLFTSVSDGDDLMSMRETSEFLAMAWSNSSLSEMIYAQLKEACKSKDLDILQMARLDTNCVRKNLADFLLSGNDLSSLPGLSDYLKSLSPTAAMTETNSFAEFELALELASRAAGYVDDTFEYADIRTMMQVIQYSENLFVRFDRDQNRILSDRELSDAMPVFRNYIFELAHHPSYPWNQNWFADGVFTYLLSYGSPPDVSFFGGVKFLAWEIKHIVVKSEASRTRLVQVLGGLGSYSRNLKIRKIADFYVSRRRELFMNPGHLSTDVSGELAADFICPAATSSEVARLWREQAPAFSKFLQVQDGSTGMGEIFAREFSRRIKFDPILSQKCAVFM